MSERRVAALALLPAFVMTAVLVLHEIRRPGLEPVAGSQAPTITLPRLPVPRLRSGTYVAYDGRLAISVQDAFDEQIVVDDAVTITLDLGADRRPTAVDIAVDLLPFCAGASDPWQGEAVYALLDAGALRQARFLSESITTSTTTVDGVDRLRCLGNLTLHGEVRRTILDLCLGAERKDRARMVGDLDLDTRAFGLPASWRFGVVRLDPIVHVRLDAALTQRRKDD